MNSAPNPDDRALVARVRQHYQPSPMTAADRTRFDARLRARVEAQRRRRLWGFGGLALAAAAAAALFFANRPVGAPPAPDAPEMAARPAVDGEAIALGWLVERPDADWLGGTTVLPADPLAVPGLSDDAVAASDDEAVAETEADVETDADGGPEWMPDEYVLLASLIEIDPYDAYGSEGDWP